jgi:hypothetical protein
MVLPLVDMPTALNKAGLRVIGNTVGGPWQGDVSYGSEFPQRQFAPGS